jgi:peptide/nickel transport system ATP-binding protein
MPPDVEPVLADSPAVGADPAADAILEINHLEARFVLDEGTVRAVDDVSVALTRGTTLGLVGESGCGKSVTARSVLQILPAGGQIARGEILYHRADGVVDIAKLSAKSEKIRRIRGKEIAMIFQEPMAAFSPAYSVGRQIGEAIRTHEPVSKGTARSRTIDLLGQVGIPQPRRVVDRHPFELSGGMLQRCMIAMALSCSPSILIADEPTTALDVTVQAQILALLKKIQAETGMSLIIISHNMGVIAEMADTVAVMYLGRVIETAPLWELFDRPQHPYTQSLLRSIPMVTNEVNPRLVPIKGNVPGPYAIPSGCRFHPRCNEFMPGTCDRAEPALMVASGQHRAACFLIGDSTHDDGD